MSVTEAKYRRPLNKEQLEVLDLLYRFRFGTAEQLAKHFGKQTGKAVQKRLTILEAQGYISKRYNGTYKLAGKPAEYYLLPKGARLLQTYKSKTNKIKATVTDKGIKNRYKDKVASGLFVAHSLHIFNLCLKLDELYVDKIVYMTKSDLQSYDYIINPLPDGYVYLERKVNGKQKHWFIKIFEDDVPLFIIIRRIKKYLSYYEEEEWEDNNFPVVLMITKSSRRQQQVHRRIVKELRNAYLDELNILFATSNTEAVMTADIGMDKIWQLAAEDKTMKVLRSIS
jgi:DNA-binding MarR family transcriptional regulator